MTDECWLDKKGDEIHDGSPFTNSHWINLNGGKQIILVDFDHVITTKCLACKDGLKDDGLQDGVREALIELSKHFQIWIFTGNYDYLDANIPVKRTVKAIREFLTSHGIPFDNVLQTKPPACFIIDDRAIHHKSWKDTLAEIKRRCRAT